MKIGERDYTKEKEYCNDVDELKDKYPIKFSRLVSLLL